MKRVAILGATGYIGKSVAYEILLEKKMFHLHLFSRSEEKLNKLRQELVKGNTLQAEFYTLDELQSVDVDVIINCAGVSDIVSLRDNPARILAITEEIDEMILAYLKRKKDTAYINISSGAVYNAPNTLQDINNVGGYYAFTKLNIEKKHRAMREFSIVDIRVFSFFSHFVDTASHFLMSEIVLCLQNHSVFQTNDEDILRDYLTPRDLLTLIKKIIDKGKINDSFDAYSRKPISKFELLSFLEHSYNLKVNIKESPDAKRGLSNNRYYPEDKKAEIVLGYTPQFSSLEGIDSEIKKIKSK